MHNHVVTLFFYVFIFVKLLAGQMFLYIQNKLKSLGARTGL